MRLEERVVRRFQAGRTYYKYDRRKLKSHNDPAAQREEAKHRGGYSKYEIRLLPIKDIRLPKVWNPGRYERAKALIEAGKPLDPIDAVFSNGKWEISDGIHRTNASKALGFTHVPAFVSTWVATPEMYEPPPEEMPRLPVGAWVKMLKPFDGKLYGWVEEYLNPRQLNGVKRHWYGLSLMDESGDWDFGDFGDHEFEPIDHPPPWLPKVKAEYGPR